MELFRRKKLTREGVDRILREAVAAADDGRSDEAWHALAPLEKRCERDAEAARGLALSLGHDALERERRLVLATELLEAWPGNGAVLAALGEASEMLRDHNDLNAAPPGHPFFERIATQLRERAATATTEDDRIRFNSSLTTASRVLGRSWDDVCEGAHRELLQLRPERWQSHYNFGLFLKTRGRFEEGVAANQRAMELSPERDESVVWNLGICATGAGQGELALGLWRDMGNKLELGDDGLPSGGYATVQVKLAERPIAERGDDTEDAPGLEETIWIERLSPCHGRILSALYGDLGVDYGDLVLFDGAPILSRKWGEREVPVFPHLASLTRRSWQIFPFAGTQEHQGQVGALQESLPGDTAVYVHTESVRLLCRSCWEHEEQTHEHSGREHKVVTGKVCAPPDADLDAVARTLDAAVEGTPHLRVLVPGLHRARGDFDRAEVERRRFAMLAGHDPA